MAVPRPPSFICSTCMRSIRSQQTRSIATRRPATDPQLPRWRQTPPAMKQPVRLRPQPFKTWKVNEDQETLDAMYDRLLSQLEPGPGKRGRDLLPEDIKWLAVTHKSFDHGRQGFNDKLAYLGARLLNLQTGLALLRAPSPPASSPSSSSSSSTSSILPSTIPDPTSPSNTPAHPSSEVYHHPSLQKLDNLTTTARDLTMDRMRLARLASGRYGLDRVLRWKPRDPERLRESGEWTVVAHGLCAVVGAVAMHRGGDVAVRCVREKILGPLGL